jgi:acyl-coenzyme A synthetase/AMP-(fatty) acid ligase
MGEVRYSSPELVQRYYRDPAATAEALRDGFFYPGDRGFVSSAGELFIVGRMDDVINIGGVKVDPNELERIAVGTEGVVDAAVFAHEGTDGRPSLAMALVTTTAHAMKSVDERIRAQSIATVPAVYFRVMELPRNEMGKLKRDNLADYVNERSA